MSEKTVDPLEKYQITYGNVPDKRMRTEYYERIVPYKPQIFASKPHLTFHFKPRSF